MKLKLTHNRHFVHHFVACAAMNFVGLYYYN